MPAKDDKKLKVPDKKTKSKDNTLTIHVNINSSRVSSRILEERIQQAVENGARNLHVIADGQHGIGGRIWPRNEAVRISVEGPVGQRLGSMAMFGTEIVVDGSVSDDVGWINCGARITVLGDVTNGAHNAAAEGFLYVQGGGGARCDTMTKQNPRFDPPQSWYFRDVGDSFAEFKAGGIAVVCGVNPRNPENILGYRPCVGMVGGAIYFRGKIKGYSEINVKQLDLTPQDWEWLTVNMKPFLEAVGRNSFYDELTRSADEWKKLIAYTPAEKKTWKKLKMLTSDFSREIWEAEVGKGGIFAQYINHDRTILPYITIGVERRNKPVWNNEKYLPPCVYNCPTHIPTHKRASLIRQGKMKEALSLVLRYSPLPATVCGQICPNLCMHGCTRGLLDRPLNIKELGGMALKLPAPKPAQKTGRKVAVIGGGPAGLSVAWQLGLKGHGVDLYEAENRLGGKIELCIPRERLPHKILVKEISRFKEVGITAHLGKRINQKAFEKIYKGHDIVIVACGAHQPRRLTFPGSGDTIAAIDFLKGINSGKDFNLKGRNVVVIGAGNAGMDVASEAMNCGAASVTAVDIQKPAAFGIEMEMAKGKGVDISWPRFTEKYDKKAKKIYFKDGASLAADLVVMSVGEVPVLDFLPLSVHTEKGWIEVSEFGQTLDVKVFAIGDATSAGLVTHAIGQGRVAADVIHAQLMQYDYMPEVKQVVPYEKIRMEYYDLCSFEGFEPKKEAELCMSCATCRDCHMCEAACYHGAIKRVGHKDGSYEYIVDDDKCIGCGFCAGVCPCGVWEMVENI